ncbi:MAG: 2-succinyl-5-enolpyruvyl-6-hydroxy-3-cyclohexene-1-carboxylic-acid synthase [Planctomycetales bacterium]|nr:2-succinyl-5-enolpyruvyl-6-hydroxy-3-cyclohexene-1-carboxylic-acid synthase [Planctomycetales bacterium]
MPTPIETARLNSLAAKLLVQSCIENGVDRFFVAPGSRCTPLTLAVAEHPEAKVVRHFDERGLAFACLGFGRLRKKLAPANSFARPAAFICTSGTAVANAYPALIEAAMDHVPMLLLTADRPPELLGIGANQAIFQNDIFGQYPCFYQNVDCPESESDVNSLPGIVTNACVAAEHGPAHLNLQFREPFGAAEPVGPSVGLRSWFETRKCSEPPHRTAPDGNTIVMVGDCSLADCQAARSMAQRISAVLLCDITAGARPASHDLALMSNPNLAAPENVIHVGGRFVSKRWLQFLSNNKSQIKNYWHVWPHEDKLDPASCVTDSIIADISEFCDSLCVPATATQESFRTQWLSAMSQASEAATSALLGECDLNEPMISRIIAENLHGKSGLFLGNSMPIRDMDLFAVWKAATDIAVMANRGASGIDGLIAAAIGAAHGQPDSHERSAPLTLVVGDLSALHDLNSLAMLADPAMPPMVIVIINNDGGGIFHFLPIAEQTDKFEQFFGTPHGLSFSHAAKMFGIAYQSPLTLAEFETAYRTALDQSTSQIIEVRTNRSDNITLHREIERAVRDRVIS